MTEGTGTVAGGLARLGLQLPPPPAPVAAFEPYVRHGGTIYVSGQIAARDGRLVATGHLGAEVDLAAGQDAARGGPPEAAGPAPGGPCRPPPGPPPCPPPL